MEKNENNAKNLLANIRSLKNVFQELKKFYADDIVFYWYFYLDPKDQKVYLCAQRDEDQKSATPQLCWVNTRALHFSPANLKKNGFRPVQFYNDTDLDRVNFFLEKPAEDPLFVPIDCTAITKENLSIQGWRIQ